MKIKQETDGKQQVPGHDDCVRKKSKHSEDGSKSAEQVEVKQGSLKYKKIYQKEAYAESPVTEQVVKKEAFDSPHTVQVEEKLGSSKQKKKISHKEVNTESPHTEQVEEK